MIEKNQYKEDIEKNPWLDILFETYNTSDALAEEELKRTRNLACHKGCSNCCKQPTVPLTQPELMGITWYVAEKMRNPIRARLKTRLAEYYKTAECPFLLDDSCSIYEVRPLICRQFLVKNQPCSVEERIEIDRPQDVVLPNKIIARSCSMVLLKYFGFHSRVARERAFKKGFLPKNTIQMHEYDWQELARRMEEFEK